MSVHDRGLGAAWWALRTALGLGVFLAGLDKFFNLLTDWTMYLSSAASGVLPVAAPVFMRAAGVIEMAVGLAILTRWTRAGAYVAMAWLAGIIANLVATGMFFDLAVRDLEIAVAMFALARLTEWRAGETALAQTARNRAPGLERLDVPA